jgi:uncharacterized membrane protein YtjA (UPF0391 family)
MVKSQHGNDMVGTNMFGAAAAFLMIALAAAAAGSTGIAATSVQIAWILFLFGAIFAALFRYGGSGGDRRRATR